MKLFFINISIIFIINLFPSFSLGIQRDGNYTVSGYVEDAGTKEKLIAANVINTATFEGAITNMYGFYSLTFPEGMIKLRFSYMGYKTLVMEIELKKDTVLNIHLSPAIEIEEVIIQSSGTNAILRSSQMSMEKIQVKNIKALPVLLGQADILKTIQLYPGVQSGNEGSGGYYVRGGDPGQNLILLDDVPVYNAYHLYGFFSVFNANAIKDVTLIKGAFPARYGGRLASVLDIRMKEGNMKKIKCNATIGLIASDITVEGPVIKDKTSFIISGRRSYINYIGDIVHNALFKNISKYYFYDFNSKINHVFSQKSRLYLSIYTGNDKSGSEDEKNYEENNGAYKYHRFEENSIDWGNITTSLRWNYIFNNKLFSNTTLIYSKYNYLTKNYTYTNVEVVGKHSSTTYNREYYSAIEDFAGKIDFDYFLNNKNKIKLGINNTFHTFNPGVNAVKLTGDRDSIPIGNKKEDNQKEANEYYLYVEDNIEITGKTEANIGMHYSGFYVDGTLYHSLQPRFSVRYLLMPDLILKASFSQMSQYIHLLSNTSIGLPTDLWVPSTKRISPEKSEQYAIGAVGQGIRDINISIEGYYKTIKNIIDYKEGASYLIGIGNWEDKVETGKGKAYGIEFFLNKETGKTTGWLGYTLSWSKRKFDNINHGREFPYKYDRRHDIKMVISRQLKKNMNINATWTFGTGNAVTLANEQIHTIFALDERDFISLNSAEFYEEKNGFRLNPYHRLDISMNIYKEKKWGKQNWAFGIFNVYNRKNPFYLYYEFKDRGYLRQKSLFPILPFINYTINI